MLSFQRTVVLLLAVLWAGGSSACTICAPADGQSTLVRQLAAADHIVMAQWTGRGQARVQAVVRASVTVGTPVGADWAPGLPAPATVHPDDSVLLVMPSGGSSWQALGYLPLARLPWLRRVAALQPAVPTAEGSQARAELSVDDLEDRYPLVAQFAYDEIAVQPYAVLRAFASRMDGKRVAQWVKDDARSARFPLYYLLLGLTGADGDAVALTQQLEQGRRATHGPELSAMLAAVVALRRDAGLAWVERYYLAARQTSDADVQAALLALSVQGTDGAVVSKEQVVAAYARYIARNPHRAGFVASDLANWGRWEFAEAFGAALRSGDAQVFSSRYAMVFYLLRNPRPQAKALVETLRAEKLM